MNSTRLHHDERGALLLTGLFMLMFLAGMLYFLIGLGRTIMMREGMQDAADASALSAAIFHAKGMNLIVFINIIMAILVGILISIKMAESFLYMMAGALVALAYFGGATAGLVAPTYNAAKKMGDFYDTMKDVVEPTLEALHSAQEATAVVVPFVAMASALNEAATYHPPAEGAFALPAAISLPVESDKFSVLCDRGAEMATEFAIDVAMAPLPRALRPPAIVLSPITAAAAEIGKLTANDLCSPAGSAPSSYEREIDKRLPEMPGFSSCEEDPEGHACKDAEENVRLSEPDKHSGRCLERCGYSDPYETYARRARVACESTDNFTADTYIWQERRVNVTYTFNGNEWLETKRDTPHYERLWEQDYTPCGKHGTMSDDWNLQSGPPSLREPEAVCSEEPVFSATNPAPGTTNRQEMREVGRIFSCTTTMTQRTQLTKEGDSIGGDDEDKSPHKVEKDLKLGSEALQIRALAFGPVPSADKLSRDGVKLASWQQTTEPETGDKVVHKLETLASQLGRFAVAQSEYFFDHDGSVAPAEWMWSMNWKARLRRFRLPSKDEEQSEEKRREDNSANASSFAPDFGVSSVVPTLEESCENSGSEDCDSASSSTNLFDTLVLH